MNLLAVVLLYQGIHIQGVDMKIPDKNLEKAQYISRNYLRDAAEKALNSLSGKMTFNGGFGAHWTQLVTQLAKTDARDAVDRHEWDFLLKAHWDDEDLELYQRVRSEAIQSQPTPAANSSTSTQPLVVAFAPVRDDRIHSTKDTPKVGPMRLLITELLNQLGDKHETLWREIVRLASTDEGRKQHGFLIGLDFDSDEKEKYPDRVTQVVVYEESGKEIRMRKKEFNIKLSEIRRGLKRKK